MLKELQNMKKIAWEGEYPKCDICSHRDCGKIDAPTVSGQWANMCASCAETMGANLSIGTMKDRDFVPVEMSATEKVQVADKFIASGDWDALEDLIGDGDICDYI